MPHGGRPENVFMDRFALEPKTQRVWGVPHATWFTLMALGGGLFILGRSLGVEEEQGRFVGVPLIDVISFAAIAVGGLVLISDLGRPLRFWRAFLNVRTSWIAWGAWSDLVFLTAAGILVLPSLEIGSSRPFRSLPWDATGDGAVGVTLEVLAGLAAVVVMFYAGAVLAKPRAIPYWHSVAVPLQFILSGFAMAMATIVALDVAYAEPIDDLDLALLAAFPAATLAVVAWHLSTNRTEPGKSHSIDQLLRRDQRAAFLGGAVVLGHGVPIVLALAGFLVPGWREWVSVAALAVLVPGGFMLRLVTLRVGIFPPVKRLPVPVPRGAASVATG